MLAAGITGSTPVGRFLFWTAVIFVAGDFFATLVTILYQRVWYRTRIRPKFKASYDPRCTIIVPCKGASDRLRSNLESFFALDSKNYEVIFVTESPEDQAVPVIKSVIAARSNASFVSAGLSSQCAQKNHNLLVALKTAHDPDVYVFADSDVHPHSQWLHELVLPLGNTKVSVTTGFRWLHATKGTAAEWMHAYANIFLYVVFSCAFFAGGVGLWGGSMAIRRRDFEALSVAKKWSRAVVDDLSLSQLIKVNRLKGVMVPSCMAHSDELLPTMGAGIAWFERQIMFLRTYFKPIWAFMVLPIAIIGTALDLLLPAAILLAVFKVRSFFAAGGGAGIVFYLGELATVSLYPLLGPMPRFYRFLILQPVLRLGQALSYFGTWTTNTIVWAGVRYRLKFFGDVTKVDR